MAYCSASIGIARSEGGNDHDGNGYFSKSSNGKSSDNGGSHSDGHGCARSDGDVAADVATNTSRCGGNNGKQTNCQVSDSGCVVTVRDTGVASLAVPEHGSERQTAPTAAAGLSIVASPSHSLGS